MARKRKDNISEVTFSYIGTDAQFDEFLKMLVHDTLVAELLHQGGSDFGGVLFFQSSHW